MPAKNELAEPISAGPAQPLDPAADAMRAVARGSNVDDARRYLERQRPLGEQVAIGVNEGGLGRLPGRVPAEPARIEARVANAVAALAVADEHGHELEQQIDLSFE